MIRNLLVISMFFACSQLTASDEVSSSPSKVSKLGKRMEKVLSKQNKKRCENEISKAFSQEEQAKMLSEVYYSDLSDNQKELLFKTFEVIQEAQGSES